MLSLLNSNSLNAAATTVNAAGANTAKTPNGIATTASAAMAKLTSTAGTAGSMGEKDFLKLFTTQLQNQDPLDPVKNEAFVAQLAQFSQLQATTTMRAPCAMKSISRPTSWITVSGRPSPTAARRTTSGRPFANSALATISVAT